MQTAVFVALEQVVGTDPVQPELETSRTSGAETEDTGSAGGLQSKVVNIL